MHVHFLFALIVSLVLSLYSDFLVNMRTICLPLQHLHKKDAQGFFISHMPFIAHYETFLIEGEFIKYKIGNKRN